MVAAAATLERAREELGDADPALAQELRATWVTLSRIDRGLGGGAAVDLELILDRSADPTYAERALMVNVANELVFRGRERERAHELALRALGDGSLLELEGPEGVAWIAAAATAGWCDDIDTFEREMALRRDAAVERGSVALFASASYGVGFARYWRGEIAESIADLEQAIEARRYGWEQFLPDACAFIARVQLELGDADAAERGLDLAGGDERWAGTAPWVFLQEARARIAMARGDAADALERSLSAGAVLVDAMLVTNPAVLPWRSQAALAAAALDDRSRASELVAEEVDLARSFGAPRPLGVALRAAGLVERGEAGIALLDEAVAVLGDSPAPIEHARALTDLGTLMRLAGRRADSREPLRRAFEMASGFGASALARRAFDELRASGARPAWGARAGRDALTPSELRVAQMAADGMTNREIAQALFVTVKAVQYHLTNVYRKLGSSDRAALAARLESS